MFDTYASRPALSFEQITVSTAVKTLSAASYRIGTVGQYPDGGYPLPQCASEAYITLEGASGTNDMRVTFDGTDPTDTLGHIIKGGATLIVKGYANIVKMKMIRDITTDVVINVTYYK